MVVYILKEEYIKAISGENPLTKNERIITQYNTERLENIGYNLKEIKDLLQQILTLLRKLEK